ncbi:hypothetical protein KEJ45_01020 [Candidatus Bathyarchaeota archaeon]|nr:hypothetical protein [Candidatus Bathyarchaeota archaeon]
MFAYGIFKIIYAPRETLKEVAQNPKYTGPILILVLFVAANLGSAYFLATKTYIEDTVPSATLLDEWTENSTKWQSINGFTPTENFTDYIAGNYYGNRSIDFSANDNDTLTLELQDIGSINCSSQGGYTTLYLRVKLANPSTPPESVTLRLYSAFTSANFYRDITGEFANTTTSVWNNLTIPLAMDGDWQIDGGSADWANITGLMLTFMWNQTSNIRVLIDGLFFGGIYKPYAEDVASYIAGYAASSLMQFFVRWVIISGIIYALSKVFKATMVWRVTLILVGFALITMFVQALINTAAFSTLPTINYSFKLMGGVPGEFERAYNQIMDEIWVVNLVYTCVQVGVLIWTVALCMLAIRSVTELSWFTSFFMAFIAYFIAIFVESFLAF